MSSPAEIELQDRKPAPDPSGAGLRTLPTMTPPILTRIADGDKTAVSECDDRYGPLVWSLARRFFGNGPEAEDAVQEFHRAVGQRRKVR